MESLLTVDHGDIERVAKTCLVQLLNQWIHDLICTEGCPPEIPREEFTIQFSSPICASVLISIEKFCNG